MRKIIQEKQYFVFRDSDGILGFTLRSYEGEPINPRFLFDGNKQAFLLRRPGQLISLKALGEEFVTFLLKSQKVRFLETPEDSSEIIRQYDVDITKIKSIFLTEKQIISAEESLVTEFLHSA